MRFSLHQIFPLLALLTACFNHTAPSPTNILIDGVIYDGFELANRDELVILRNLSDKPVALGGWQITDGDSGTAVFPPNTQIFPHDVIWLTKNGTSFSQRFHHVADFELMDSHPLIDNLQGSWPGFTDVGDEIILLDASGAVVDVLVFKSGTIEREGWTGTAVYPIYIEEEGVFLHRLRQQDSNLPQPDSNRAADWTQSPAYAFDGRTVGAPSRVGSNLQRIENP
jgi:hypothetical protein